MAEGAKPRVLLVCSPGGHLAQMLCLEEAWRGFDRTWVTLESVDAEHLLEHEHVVVGHGPTNRSLRALIANLPLAWRVVRSERPDAILSTGAALAVPFFLVGRLHGARLVFVESLTRTRKLSLTGRLVYPLADVCFVQWPQAARRAKMRFAGNLL
ncbi:MAG TPA: UDP-N-acetylglucosamine--LPS N-acetylglucosamine transferase [Solirubrobacterales bacterium]